MGVDICNAFRDFFSNGQTLKENSHMFIALVPKVITLLKVNDYRPISCCNVIYKCISKIITNRIVNGIKEVVSDNQSAFVLGRHISDNILFTQELMHNYHRNRGPPMCAFKIDIQKAYDIADWNFLRKESVASRGPVITISFYFGYGGFDAYLAQEDDLFIFARGDVESAKVIVDSLEEFKLTSGLVLSIPKSTTCFCNVLTNVKLAILSIIPFFEGTELVTGRINLCLLPVGFNFLIHGFFLCNGEYKHRKAKVAWDNICLPHSEGGLGLRNLEILILP
ncbi:reverse transcriptase domain, reverse transcriptase zinc-binding domain protein [Tanacetum coccineum]